MNHSGEEEEPVQLGRSRLSPETWEQLRWQLCLYCGGDGHLIRSCPVQPNRPGSLEAGVLVSRTDIPSPSYITNILFPVSLAWGLETLSVGALLDSGADECLIDVTLARQAGIPLEPMDTTLSVQALDGHLLGKISHRTISLSLYLFPEIT